jgi:hypothetical protein
MTLEARDNAAAFVIATSIAPRFIPASSPVSMEEAERLNPPRSTVKWFGLDIAIDFICLSPIKTVTCPTHTRDLCVATNGKSCRATLCNIGMDRDVVILIEKEKSHQPRACVEVSEDGKATTGLVAFFPHIESPDQQREFFVFCFCH